MTPMLSLATVYFVLSAMMIHEKYWILSVFRPCREAILPSLQNPHTDI